MAMATRTLLPRRWGGRPAGLLGGDAPAGRHRLCVSSLSWPLRSCMLSPGPSLLLWPLAARARHVSLAVIVQRRPLSHAPVSGV